MSAVPEQTNRQFQVATVFVLTAALLAGCGSSDPDLPKGDDFSASALQASVTPGARILIQWDSVDDANRYRVSVDRDGEGEADFGVLGDYLVEGADVAGLPRFFIYNVAPNATSTVAWNSVQFKVENCVDVVVDDVADLECNELVLGFSIEPIPPGQLLFDWLQADDISHYRLSVDLNGNGNFQQLGADLPDDQVFFVWNFAALNIDWDVARFMLEGCAGDVCENLGEQAVRGISSFSVSVFQPPATLFNSNYGASLAVSEDGNTMAVGAPGESEFVCEEIFGLDEVDVLDVLEEADGIFPACTYIIPTDTIGDPSDPDDDFIAPTSLTEVVALAGVVYVYARDELGWIETSRLESPNFDAGDNMGWAVALSADGTTLAVSSRFEDSAAVGVGGEQDDTDNEAPDSGAVYVYVFEEGGWNLQEYIKATNTETEDLFGWQVALSGDGDTLAVAGVLEKSNGDDPANNDVERAGAVYTYTRADGVWTPQDYLKPVDAGEHDLFGISLVLSANGEFMAVGAVEEGAPPPPEEQDGRFRLCNPISDADSGSVYIFQRDADQWLQTAMLKASNADQADCFGFSVALDEDGSRLAVGAPTEDSIATGVNGADSNNSQPNSGAAYVFERSGTNWAQTDYLKASNTGTPDLFGTSVALSSGGKILIVGAIGESSLSFEINGSEEFNTAPGAGAAYAFKLKNDSWRQVAFVKGSRPQAAANFGWKIALALNGERLAVSAPGWELSTGYPGLVFVF